MCIEREKVDFKSREANCLKECALALKRVGSAIWKSYKRVKCKHFTSSCVIL